MRPKRQWLLLIIHLLLTTPFIFFMAYGFSCFQQTLSWARHLLSCPQQQKEAQLWKTCPMPIPSSRSPPGQCPSLLVPVWGFYVCALQDDGVSVWFVSCRMCAGCSIEVKYVFFLKGLSYATFKKNVLLSNVVKNCYSLKTVFYILNVPSMQFIPVMAKLNFQHHYSSHQCHIILQKSF